MILSKNLIKKLIDSFIKQIVLLPHEMYLFVYSYCIIYRPPTLPDSAQLQQ